MTRLDHKNIKSLKCTVAIATVKRKESTYSVDPGRMLMEAICELERQEKKHKIKCVTLPSIDFQPTQ